MAELSIFGFFVLILSGFIRKSAQKKSDWKSGFNKKLSNINISSNLNILASLWVFYS